MDCFRDTAIYAGLLYARTQDRFLRETAGDLIRATGLAARAVENGEPDAPFLLKSVRELVLACAGGAWVRDHAEDSALLELQTSDLVTGASREGARLFDALCAALLQARFPSETERRVEHNARAG